MKEKGYNPVNQIVGYIMSGDPTYITNHNNARTLIRKIDRDELLQILDIDKSMLAKVYESCEVTGHVSDAAAALTGLSPVDVAIGSVYATILFFVYTIACATGWGRTYEK